MFEFPPITAHPDVTQQPPVDAHRLNLLSHGMDKTTGASSWRLFSRLQKATETHKAANTVQNLLIHAGHKLAHDAALCPTGRGRGQPTGEGGLGWGPLSGDFLSDEVQRHTGGFT